MLVEDNLAPGGQSLERVITTEHGTARVITGIHQSRHKRRQGGVRFVTRGSLEELAHLAHGMTEKASAANVAIDGMKALVICHHGVPKSADDRARLLSEHIEQAIKVDPQLVFGPDMGCQEDVLDIVATKYRHLANVTGLSRRCGGLEIDVNGLTAHGVIAGIVSALPELTGLTAAVQGFGAVGAHTARALDRLGVRVVAISNLNGTYWTSERLDIPDMFKRWALSGDAGLLDYASEVERDLDPARLFDIECDILVPAARTSVFGLASEIRRLSTENPKAQPIETYLKRTGVRLIAEAANHPLSFAAEEYAVANDVQVLPDVIINCGGMIGCCYEYDNRDALLSGAIDYETALDKCRSLIERTVQGNIDPAIDQLARVRNIKDVKTSN